MDACKCQTKAVSRYSLKCVFQLYTHYLKKQTILIIFSNKVNTYSVVLPEKEKNKRIIGRAFTGALN
jgi:ketopantoate reductase